MYKEVKKSELPLKIVPGKKFVPTAECYTRWYGNFFNQK